LAVGALLASSACSGLLGVNGDRTLSSTDGGVSEGPDTGAPDQSSPLDSGGEIGAEASGIDGGTIDPLLADKAVEALILSFWDQFGDYLLASTPAGPNTAAGSFAEAWEVVLDAVGRHDRARFQGTLATFFAAQAAHGWGPASFTRYDDENWMTLALIRAYDLTGDNKYLLQARSLYEDLMLSGWDTTCCGAPARVPGGIWSDRSQTHKSASVNAGAVISGARLYERTQITQYRTFAAQVYDYWSKWMVDPVTHQVTDSVTASGAQTTPYARNEGVMIGAAVALAEATKDDTPLALAHQIASFMLTHETTSAPGYVILADPVPCTTDCSLSKGIAARYLANLYAAAPSHTEYLALLARSAQSALANARDPSSWLFNTDWSSPFLTAVLDAQTSAATLLAAVARFGGGPPADPPNRYEAEEGVTHTMLYEQSYLGYTGWGYLAHWGCGDQPCPADDGEAVDFLVDAPAAGRYALTFRYAANNGVTALRRLVVNGGDLDVDAFPFSPTINWEDWTSQSELAVSLHAGANTVSLIYDASRNSTGYLNLDHLTVSTNLVQAQPTAVKTPPDPTSWDDGFPPPYHGALDITNVTSVTGEPATRWQGKALPANDWLKVFVDSYPFSAGLVPGSKYTASVIVTGTGSCHLDVWNGSKDSFASPVTLSDTPQVLSLAFQMSAAGQAEFQIRNDGPKGGTVDIDVTMWDVAVYPSE
jgi:predicted alpha-1,6-mannanase (GH76 family)